MPWIGITPAHRRKLAEGRRRKALDRIAVPLWHAIAAGHTAEAAHLQAKYDALVKAQTEAAAEPVQRIDAYLDRVIGEARHGL